MEHSLEEVMQQELAGEGVEELEVGGGCFEFWYISEAQATC